MNKKSAFFVVVKLYQNMGFKEAISGISVELARGYFKEESVWIQELYGKNIQQVNRPIISYLKDIAVQ